LPASERCRGYLDNGWDRWPCGYLQPCPIHGRTGGVAEPEEDVEEEPPQLLTED
jgi:hypothetical protein